MLPRGSKRFKSSMRRSRVRLSKSMLLIKPKATRTEGKSSLIPGTLCGYIREKNTFPPKENPNLCRAEVPFEVLECINTNAYKLNLPGDYGVSAIFNVANLSPYLEDDTLENLREISPQQGEDEGDQDPS